MSHTCSSQNVPQDMSSTNSARIKSTTSDDDKRNDLAFSESESATSDASLVPTESLLPSRNSSCLKPFVNTTLDPVDLYPVIRNNIWHCDNARTFIVMPGKWMDKLDQKSFAGVGVPPVPDWGRKKSVQKDQGEGSSDSRIEEVEVPLLDKGKATETGKGPTISEAIRPTSPIPPRKSSIEQVLDEEDEEEEHPYSKIKPGSRNIPAISTKPLEKGNQVDRVIIDEVYQRVMNEPNVSISQKELWSILSGIREKVKKATATIEKVAPQSMLKTESDSFQENDETALPGSLDDTAQTHRASRISQYRLSAKKDLKAADLPPGSFIIQDLFDLQLQEQPNGEQPHIKVARDSQSIRSVTFEIDSRCYVECIVDRGSLIIAMSDQLANDLGLVYDPTVILEMESVNGTTDSSLGLARNVPFTIDDITLYMQVHILKEPAYDILLGRPFDTFTESVIRNFPNGQQLITIMDPHTGLVRTIPTQRRGLVKHMDKPPLKV
ncbi:hypothetical protein C8J56DRAFT_1054194 [Mycena floridula]|nr:hypothetical protein C8J56DRAFT_1054194 [Mycena floridula]